jgi:ribosome-associated heat shock protein Hsp15
MNAEQRQRVDLWLFRARLTKTRAAAARLISEGGVRVSRAGATRLLDKPSAEVAPGDVLVFALRGRLHALEIKSLPTRRGPAGEAQRSYASLERQDAPH